MKRNAILIGTICLFTAPMHAFLVRCLSKAPQDIEMEIYYYFDQSPTGHYTIPGAKNNKAVKTEFSLDTYKCGVFNVNRCNKCVDRIHMRRYPHIDWTIIVGETFKTNNPGKANNDPCEGCIDIVIDEKYQVTKSEICPS